MLRLNFFWCLQWLFLIQGLKKKFNVCINLLLVVISPVMNIWEKFYSHLAGMCCKPTCSLIFPCGFWTCTCWKQPPGPGKTFLGCFQKVLTLGVRPIIDLLLLVTSLPYPVSVDFVVLTEQFYFRGKLKAGNFRWKLKNSHKAAIALFCL